VFYGFLLKEELTAFIIPSVDQVPETMMRLIVNNGSTESLLVDKI
jgi:hypothetical protein